MIFSISPAPPAPGFSIQFSFIPLQLPLAPMRLFAIQVEFRDAVTVQRFHIADQATVSVVPFSGREANLFWRLVPMK